ncbi:MAG: hypothetical protein HGA45_26855 [Chloroflexales bacterium]|nr:hypothetical protein [Chloroflexales bacterium]
MWYENRWFYSVIDVVAVLTESVNPNRYWNTLKSRDNRLRLTDVADRETFSCGRSARLEQPLDLSCRARQPPVDGQLSHLMPC